MTVTRLVSILLCFHAVSSRLLQEIQLLWTEARSYGAILKLIFQGRYALPKGYVSRLRCSFEVNLID